MYQLKPVCYQKSSLFQNFYSTFSSRKVANRKKNKQHCKYNKFLALLKISKSSRFFLNYKQVHIYKIRNSKTSVLITFLIYDVFKQKLDSFTSFDDQNTEYKMVHIHIWYILKKYCYLSQNSLPKDIRLPRNITILQCGPFILSRRATSALLCRYILKIKN